MIVVYLEPEGSTAAGVMLLVFTLADTGALAG